MTPFQRGARREDAGAFGIHTGKLVAINPAALIQIGYEPHSEYKDMRVFSGLP